MAKRNKGKHKRTVRRASRKKPHRFLKEATRRFITSKPQVEATDAAVIQVFQSIQEAIGIPLFMVSAALFRVETPRPPVLPDDYSPLNIQTLWHGSRCENGMSILRNGFRVGPGMFGYGVYVGPKAKATSHMAFRTALNADPFMLLKLNVALGNVFVAEDGMKRIPEGYHSVMGRKGYTKSWHMGTLRHDEWCVRNPCQLSILEIHLVQ
jgi:hypothetical protein